jgi:hypothetical protein
MSQAVHMAYQFRDGMLPVSEAPVALYGDGGDRHHDHQLRDDETLTAVCMVTPLESLMPPAHRPDCWRHLRRGSRFWFAVSWARVGGVSFGALAPRTTRHG